MSATEVIYRISSASVYGLLSFLSTSALSTAALNVNVTVPIFSVSIVGIGAAAIGAATAGAFTDPLESRYQLFSQTLAATVFGAVFSALITGALDLKWARELPGAFALASGGGMRLFLPPIIKRARELIAEANIPGLRWIKPKKDNEQ